MFGQVTNYETKLFISNRLINAVEAASFSYSHSATTNKFLGFGKTQTMIGGVPQQTLSINRNLIYKDPLFGLFNGEFPVSGSIHYNKGYYGFLNGRITDYSVSCAVGSFPQVNANITVFDEMKRGIEASGLGNTTGYLFANQGSVSVTCDGSSTNRVLGFDYAVKANFKPVYVIGQTNPSEVINLSKAEYTASVQIDVDNGFMFNSKAFIRNALEAKTVTFSIRDSTPTGEVIQSLTIPNASLVSETLACAANGGVKLTLNYIGHSQ